MKDVGEFSVVAQEEIRQDLRAMLRGAIRAGLEVVLAEELERVVGADWYARVAGRRDRRNGAYVRRLLTTLGAMELTVPRTRGSGSVNAVVGRYRRRTAEVDALLTSAYVNGVSARKAGDLTAALMGERVSRSTVSRVAKGLDAQVAALQRAPIPATIRTCTWTPRSCTPAGPGASRTSRRWWRTRWARTAIGGGWA